MLRFGLLVALCIASAQAESYDGYGHGSASMGYGDILDDGQNYEVNYSGPKANPIVVKYAPSSHGHDNVYGYGKANGHGRVHGYGDYSYAHGDVLGNGQNYEVNYSGPKANPIVAKYAPSSYGHENVYGYGKANGHGSVHGYGDYSYAHGDVLGNGQNYEVNYSGPKANPIVAKYAPSSYGHDHVYGYGKANGYGSVHGYGDYTYAHDDVLGNGQNYEVNYSGPKANPIVAKYAPASYAHGNAYGRDGVVYGHGDVVYGSGNLGYGHGGYAALNSGNKGYRYAKELPIVGGVGYVAESKPTGFLYKNARYIGHGSSYVPYTARYKKAYKKLSGYSDLH